MKDIETILRDYTSGETTLEETNTALADAGMGVKLDPEKNTIKPGEENAYGLMDTGTGSLDKVRIKGGKLVHSVGTMAARVYWKGVCYDVTGGDTLTPHN